MLMKFVASIFSILLIFNSVQAQNDENIHRYIEQFRDIAISEMHRTGIPASITLAQGIIESNSGRSRLATKGNNHFGIKCHKGWTGGVMYHDDDAKGECFRTYSSAHESYIDHSEFLTGRSRYNDLFSLNRDDFEGWAHGLKKAGYATNPQYAFILIKKVKEYYLYIYDKPNWQEKLEIVALNRQLSQGDYSNVPVASSMSPVSSGGYSTLNDGEVVVRTYVPGAQNQNVVEQHNSNDAIRSPEVVREENYTMVQPPVVVEDKVGDSYYGSSYVEIPKEEPAVVYEAPSNPPATTYSTPSIAEAETKPEPPIAESKTQISKPDRLPIKPASYLTYYNRRKVIIYNYGVTVSEIANEYNVAPKRIVRYNEIEYDEYIPANTKIFLQPKRSKAPFGTKYHKVSDGEDMASIAQLYGIKQKKLYRKNRMYNNQQASVGEILHLRKKRKSPPKLIGEYDPHSSEGVIFSKQKFYFSSHRAD